MDLETISLAPIRAKTVAILGYGNQGRTHALNLRDSGVRVVVGARPGKGADRARVDGFEVVGFAAAVRAADIVMFLFADAVIPVLHDELAESLRAKGSRVGFAHGYALHFQKLQPLGECGYFLVAPKGPGAVLRENFEKGGGLPGAYALGPGMARAEADLVRSYAKAIGVASMALLESTFQEETEGDLFGEQAVLCGGMIQLVEAAFEALVAKGHQPKTAFFDVCYEATVLLQLWMKFGPAGFAERISPTAFYGGVTRGRRLVDAETKRKIDVLFEEIRTGAFTAELDTEMRTGQPVMAAEKKRIAQSLVQKTYESLGFSTASPAAAQPLKPPSIDDTRV